MAEQSPRDRRLRQLGVALLCLSALALVAGLLPVLGTTGAGAGIGSGGDSLGSGLPDGLGGASSTPIVGASDSTSTGATENPFSDANQSIPQLVVNSPEPAYWRIGAYNQYRDGEWTRAAGPPLDTPTAGERITQTVTLKQPAGALPAAWQPQLESVSGTGSQDLEYSTEGGIHVDGRLPAGTEYTVKSVVPDPSPSALRGVDDQPIPKRVDERYTNVPSGVPDRVATKTDAIIQNASATTQYDAAVAIRDWIRTTKEYSLDAEHEQGTDPVDQFLFEMEAGYCQYTAASMAVMLQTKDIPARYTTGYAPGTAIDTNTYQVTTGDAHAWVEVYFPEYGWVPFDPTPPSELNNGSSSTSPSDGTTGDGNQSDGGQQNDDNTTENPEEDDESQNDGDNQTEVPPEYRITTEGEVTPGNEITIRVTYDNEPAPDEEVRIIDNVDNETYWTDSQGEITYTVPYTDRIEVQLLTATQQTQTQAQGQSQTVHTLMQDTDRVTTTQEVSEEFPVEVDLNVSVSPTPLVTGGDMTTEVTEQGSPLENVTVTVDGTEVGTTDEEGTVTGTVPAGVTGNVTIRAQIGGLSAETTAYAGDLALTTSHQYLIALPGQETTVTAMVGDRPLTGVPLAQNGDPIGATDENGAFTTTLPTAATTAFTVTYGGVTTTTTVGGLYRNVLGVIGGGLLLTGLGIVLLRRRGLTARRLLSGLQTVIAAILNGFVGLATHLSTLITVIVRRLTGGWTAIKGLPGELYRRWQAWRPASFRQVILGQLLGVLATLRRLLARTGSTATEAGETDEESMTAAGRRRIRAAWRRFVRMVFNRGAPTKTPGEVARQAIDAGFPLEPVKTLVGVFRRTEYGNGTSEEYADTATDAITEIEEQTETDTTRGSEQQ